MRGRFAKNDDYGEPSSRVAHNHDEYDHMVSEEQIFHTTLDARTKQKLLIKVK